MPSPETRLVLIRHGESRAQADAFISGHDTCSGLSEKGRRQAAALAERLLATRELADAATVFTSILPRAIETAELLAPAFGEVAPRQECEWCEIHPGEAEGLSWKEYQDRYPGGGTLDNPFRQRTPGGETWAEFYARAGARLHRIADEHPGELVVVVCHGGIIGASFLALGDLPVRAAAGPVVDAVNTGLTEWRWREGRWRLLRFNDAAHLANL